MDLSFVKEFIPSETIKKYIETTEITPQDCILLILDSDTTIEKRINALQKIVDGFNNLDELCHIEGCKSVTASLKNMIDDFNKAIDMLKNGVEDGIYTIHYRFGLNTDKMLLKTWEEAMTLLENAKNTQAITDGIPTANNLIYIKLDKIGVEQNAFHVECYLDDRQLNLADIAFTINGRYVNSREVILRSYNLENIKMYMKPFKRGDVVRGIDRDKCMYAFNRYDNDQTAYALFSYMRNERHMVGISDILLPITHVELVCEEEANEFNNELNFIKKSLKRNKPE